MLSSNSANYIVNPFSEFVTQLNIPEEIWEEELNKIYIGYDLPCAQAQALELRLLKNLVDNYGDAVVCEFEHDEYTVLELNSSINQQELDNFKFYIERIPSIRLIFNLNKEKLFQKIFSNLDNKPIKPYLFLFNAALEYFLSSEWEKLEQDLWSHEQKKIVILIIEKTVLLEGKYISIYGGEEIFNLNNLTFPTEQDFNYLKNIHQKCIDTVHWQGIELNYLTPLHFEFQQLDNSSSNLPNILRHQIVQLIIIYLADITREKNKEIISTFNTTQKNIDLKIPRPINFESGISIENIKYLLNLFKWLYVDSTSSYDRFPIAQITIVQCLHFLNENLYYDLFISKSKLIFDDTQWRCKAFVEGKIDDYIEQELKLEDYIASSINSFEKEISSQIKSISDTIKGAISITIGSFIAALLKGDFNPLIFRLGLGLYLLYMIVFPGFFTMTNLRHRYNQIVNSYELQISRFKTNLYSQKVDDIIGNRVFQEKEKFNGFFILIICCYVVIIVFGVWAMISIPELVSNSNP